MDGAESGVEGAESGWRGRNRGWRGREAGVEGAGAGIEGAGSLERLGKEIDFFYRKFRGNGSFRPISYIKVHQINICIFVWTMFFTRPS